MNRYTLLLPFFLAVFLMGFSFVKHSTKEKKADLPRVKPEYSQSNTRIFAYETQTSAPSFRIFRDNSTRANPGSDTIFLATIRKLDAVFDKTPYYTELLTNTFIMYAKVIRTVGMKTPSIQESSYWELRMETEKLILPVAYTKIYNPGATAQGHVEIESNGKGGLFNYSNGKILPPTYDFIFPALLDEQIAIGKKGNKHYAILKNGKEQLLTGDKIPGYSKLGRKGTFDVNAVNIKHLYDSYAAPEDREYGIVFTPSYFQNLGIPPDRQYLLTKKPEELVLEGVLSS